MRYLLAILLDGFYASALKSKGGPTVVYRGKRVLDACEEARLRGVAPHMALAEARSILAADGHFVEWQEEPYREPQRRWLEAAAEFSDIVEPLSQHEALVDLSGHPRPREAAEQLRLRLGADGHRTRVGLARCRWVARSAARKGDPLGLAHSDPKNYISDEMVSHLPIDPKIANHLSLLGYATAAQVARLGFHALSGLFGSAAVAVQTAANGGGDCSVRPLFPEASVAARFVFDGVPETRGALDAGLRRIAGEIGAELVSRDETGKRIDLFLEREDASVERLSRTFSKPITDAGAVRFALSLLLPEGLCERIESVRVRMPDLKAARRVQIGIDGERSRSDRDESMRIALQHVRGTFGDTSVRLAADIPEPRWVKVRRAYMEVNGHPWT